MRTRFLLLAVFAFGVAGSTLWAMEHDIHDMQARLASQEARINDYMAKLNGGNGGGEEGGAEAITSLRKNAKVTIGGLVNTKYTYTKAKIDSIYDGTGAVDGAYRRRADSKTGSLEVADAELAVQIDVNDNFEAFLNIDMHNGTEDDYWNADVYYVRWKEICNTGFGLKVGRDALVFGTDGVGELGSYVANGGDGLSELHEDFMAFGGLAGARNGDLITDIIPLHNGWDVSGVTQVTPYWEGLDGKVSFELSLMQSIYEDRPYVNGLREGAMYSKTRDGRTKYRSRNYGLGTMSARLGLEPIENLKFTLSFANYRSNGSGDFDRAADPVGYSSTFSQNNTVYGLAASWRPCFFDRLMVWGQWIHGENVYFFRDMKSDAINFGAAFDLKEGLTVFAQGDYLRTKYDAGDANSKGTAWAFYTGIQYSLPYGVSLEAGWKHEKVTYKDHGVRTARAKADTIYAMCGFEF